MDEIHLASTVADDDISSIVNQRVQELAIDVKEPPSRYIRKANNGDNDFGLNQTTTVNDNKDDCLSSSLVPIIDLQHLSSPSIEEKEVEMERLRSALTSWGLFQAVGHGIPNTLLDEVRNISKQFFKLPVEEKQRYSKPGAGAVDTFGDLEGYGNDPVTSGDQVLNWNDRLYLLVKPEEQRKLHFWPEYPNHFRDTLHEFSVQSSLVAEVILKTMSQLLGLEEKYLQNQLGEQASVYVRFNYYPPCPRPDLVYGMTPHTDAGGITIILQDKVEGLQVLKDEKWIKVPTTPHALLINMADLMEIMSNGQFKSPVHRVITNAEKERISLAMFFTPELDKEIQPAAELIDDDRKPRLFKKVIVKEYLKYFLPRYLEGKRAINWAKV